MSNFLQVFSPDNQVFRAYALYTGITVGKMLLMGPLTASYRFKNKVRLLISRNRWDKKQNILSYL